MFIVPKGFFPSKAFLSVIGTPLLWLALLGPGLAQDASAPSARLDRLQIQMSDLRSKLQVAQGYGYGRPPGNIGDEDGAYNAPPPRQDAAGLEVRVGRLEDQLRQMTGEIEQIQFAQHKLEDQLKKFQQDVDFRFQDSHATARPQKRTDAPESEIVTPNPSSAANAGADTNAPAALPLRGNRRADAFDPAADPDAPGAPRQLGSIASSATALPPPVTAPSVTSSRTASEGRAATVMRDDDADPNAPLDLSSGKRSAAPSSAGTPPGFGTAAAPRQIPLTPAPQSPAPDATQTAGVPPVVSPKEEFDIALGYFKQKEYENAEKNFSSFLQKNPKNKLVADATYYLGETYFQRGLKTEAAQQFLKIRTDYATSPRAPEAMLRLGQSLSAIGAKDQACATFGEVTHAYPNAAAWVKTGVERESKRAQC